MLNPAAMRLAYLACASLALALTPACTLHFGDDDDDYQCLAGAEYSLDPGLLDPDTLECQTFGGGCGCGPCPAAEADAIALPSWGSCASSCFGLDETGCTFTAGCRTAYDDACLFTDEPCPLLTPFLGCFPVDQSGPVQGSCEGLDVWECSRHDDCLATYSPGPTCRDGLDDDRDGVVDDSDECDLSFQRCAAELVPECPPSADCG